MKGRRKGGNTLKYAAHSNKGFAFNIQNGCLGRQNERGVSKGRTRGMSIGAARRGIPTPGVEWAAPSGGETVESSRWDRRRFWNCLGGTRWMTYNHGLPGPLCPNADHVGRWLDPEVSGRMAHRRLEGVLGVPRRLPATRGRNAGRGGQGGGRQVPLVGVRALLVGMASGIPCQRSGSETPTKQTNPRGKKCPRPFSGI